jgi:hypothetical protein
MAVLAGTGKPLGLWEVGVEEGGEGLEFRGGPVVLFGVGVVAGDHIGVLAHFVPDACGFGMARLPT